MIFKNLEVFDVFRNSTVSYGLILYKAYDTKVTEIIKPISVEISNTKDGHIDNLTDPSSKNVPNQLFALYMKLKAFSDKGLELYGGREFGTKNYFEWFSGGIDKWCEVSVFSALSR